MVAFEELCEKKKPELVVVVGDVNSTLACSVVAKKLMLRVAHVEAGLRSFDLTMPEEINRMVTDLLSDYLFVTENSGMENLLKEGRPTNSIYFVGNVMIDNLFYQLRELDGDASKRFSMYDLKNKNRDYAFLTLHRSSNVDSRDTFEEIAAALKHIAEERPIFFPMHPRTQKMMNQLGIKLSKNIVPLPPLSFKESLFLWKDASVVMTDSGGLQEETTALSVPCVTLRENTQRPITIELGTNVLGGTKKDSILQAYRKSMEKDRTECSAPPKWDGRAAERIWQVILDSGSN